MSGLAAQSENHLGVFWDIENCPIPRKKFISDFVKKVRDYIIRPYNYREYEFFCSCDTRQLPPLVCGELNSAGVTIAHVAATSKNASDDKIKEQITKFVDVHGTQCTILLITGDVKFTPILRGLKDRIGLSIILMHTANTPDELVSCANAGSFCLEDFCEDLPERVPKFNESRGTSAGRNVQAETLNYVLEIGSLPQNEAIPAVKAKLQALTQDWGGKVFFVNNEKAKVGFSSQRAMQEARHCLNGHVLSGTRLQVKLVPHRSRSARRRCSSRDRKIENNLIVTGIPMEFPEENMRRILLEKSGGRAKIVRKSNGEILLSFENDAQSQQAMQVMVGSYFIDEKHKIAINYVRNRPLTDSKGPNVAQNSAANAVSENCNNSAESSSAPTSNAQPVGQNLNEPRSKGYSGPYIITISGLNKKLHYSKVKETLFEYLGELQPKKSRVEDGVATLTYFSFKIYEAAAKELLKTKLPIEMSPTINVKACKSSELETTADCLRSLSNPETAPLVNNLPVSERSDRCTAQVPIKTTAQNYANNNGQVTQQYVHNDRQPLANDFDDHREEREPECCVIL